METNAIIGDNTGVDLPQMQPDPDLLIEEQRMAKYSKTGEFKKIQEHFEDRIKFYQTYLPGGRPISTVDPKDLESMWVVANIITDEFTQVINLFERAREVVEEQNGKV